MVDCPYCKKNIDKIITQKAMTRKQTEFLTEILFELENASHGLEKAEYKFNKILRNNNWFDFLCDLGMIIEKDPKRAKYIPSMIKTVLDYNSPGLQQEYQYHKEFRENVIKIIKKNK